MALGLATSLRNDRAAEITAALDAGAGGFLFIYSGVRPSFGGAAGTALATWEFPQPSAPAPSGGVLTFNALPPENVAVSGSASWFRFSTDGGTPLLDGDCGVTGSGADMELDSTTLVSGRLITVDSIVLTEGNV